jgi:hypothetical protein
LGRQTHFARRDNNRRSRWFSLAAGRDSADAAAIARTGNAEMRRAPEDGWYPIENAPFDEGVTLQVTDGRGEPYTPQSPSRLVPAARGRVARSRAARWG